jgi:hypothetical protein
VQSVAGIEDRDLGEVGPRTRAAAAALSERIGAELAG